MVACPACSEECDVGAAECSRCGVNFSSALAVGGMSTISGGAVTQMRSSTAATRVGQIMGSYRLLEVLGEGGMGAVYLAEHVKLGRKVALKMLHPQFADMPEVIKRFFAEAKAVNQIFHEHIVEITDFVENEHEQNYFIMEYLKGSSLGEVLDREGRLPLARSIGILVQVCSALSVVHDAGIIHRDLKPDNIFITERAGQKDFVKLLDFGVAKLLDTTGKTMSVQTTAVGMVLGTPEYMSPEQARGKDVDYRTDIYSIGVILYELATGKKPFVGETFGDLVIAHSTQEPTTPSKVEGLFQDIPPALDELIKACLAKEPQGRPQTTKEIEEKLREIARQHAVSLEHFDLSPKPVLGRKRLIVAGVAAAAAVVVSLLAFGGSDDAKPRDVATLAPVSERPPPAPIPTEPASADVVVSIDSVPSGAEVFAAGSDERLGTTPFKLTRQRSGTPTQFEIRMDGFAPVTRVVSLERDAHIAVEFARVEALASGSAAKAPTSAGKPKRVKPTPTSTKPKPKQKPDPKLRDGAVMNPFAND